MFFRRHGGFHGVRATAHRRKSGSFACLYLQKLSIAIGTIDFSMRTQCTAPQTEGFMWLQGELGGLLLRILLRLGMPQNDGSGETRDDHHEDSGNHDDHKVGKEHGQQDLDGSHDSDGCRDEHHGHRVQEKVSSTLDLWKLHKPRHQCKEQKNHSIHTGWYRQRQQGIQKLSEKSEGNDPHDFFYIFHGILFSDKVKKRMDSIIRP